ncbi:MAG: hypothetical protein AAF559_08590 [Pseudomonadota bacterium]
MSSSNKKTALLAFGAVWGVIIIGAIGSQGRPVDRGSDTAPESAPLPTDEVTWKLVAERVVKERLRDPDSAEFSDMQVHPPTEDRAAIICGYVNSKNGFGGMTGPQRFIAGGTVLIEEQVTAEQMQFAWDRFCQ